MRILFSCITVSLLVWLCGCGGGNGASLISNTGADASITIIWPTTKGRVIPLATQSVSIVIQTDGHPVVTRLVDRPADSSPTTVQFHDLPTGTLGVEVTAFPLAEGQGVPLAASSPLTLTTTPGQNTPLNITMAFTIDHLELTPDTATLNLGDTTTLTVVPKDAQGNIVLVTGATLTWSASSSVVTVNNGVVTAAAPGAATVTVTESESQKQATATITVRTPPSFALTADKTSLLYGETTTLRWSATNATDVVSSNFNAAATTGTLTITPLVNTVYTLTVRGPGGQATATLPVSVAAVSLSAPSPVTVSVYRTLQLTAAVTGAANSSVQWQVVEPNGGSITNDGLYTAPATHGTYHVNVTSRADPTKTAQITVQVQGADIDISIN